MIIYKIVLNEEFRYVGSTIRTIRNKRFGHRVCAKNPSSCCSLYKKIRDLNIEPTSIDLEIIEELNDNEDCVSRLMYLKKIHNSNLQECRSDLYIDGRLIIKKSNMGCECVKKNKKIITGKPYIMRFD